MPRYTELPIFLWLITLITCSIHKTREKSIISKNLTLQITNTSNDVVVTTVLPESTSLDPYYPEDAAFTPATVATLNVTSPELLSPGTPRYVCNGAAYGRNLDVASCTDAVESMTEFEAPRSFGQRGEADWDVNLPFRFLSSKTPFYIYLRLGQCEELCV